jgi:hypothetical protein
MRELEELMGDAVPEELQDVLENIPEGARTGTMGLDTSQSVTVMTGEMPIPNNVHDHGEDVTGKMILLHPGQAAIVFEVGTHGSYVTVADKEHFFDDDSCVACGDTMFSFLVAMLKGGGTFWADVKARVAQACIAATAARSEDIVEDVGNIDNYDLKGLLSELQRRGVDGIQWE